jgi:hypothetical protein
MTLLTSFSGRVIVRFFIISVLVCGCATAKHPVVNDNAVIENKVRIAAWPFSNRSRNPAPLKDMRRSLVDSLRQKGIAIVDEEVVQRFIEGHRLRYMAGISSTTARDLRWETGAEAVLLTTIELYSDITPPKIAITSRLVSTGGNATILWMDGVGLAGDDSIGFLELSIIKDPDKLVKKALRHLSASLAAYLSGQKYWKATERKIVKFWPKVIYRSPIIEPGKKYTVAVVPFFNLGERRFAGEVMTLHFVRKLVTLGNFTVTEPGLVRQALLQMRIIMEDGVSLADADALFSRLDVDLVVAGKVFDYQDYQGTVGTPKVDFSALLIERKSREVVWTCQSHNEGDYGVFFFDWGKVNTAHAMASEMVAAALETLVE